MNYEAREAIWHKHNVFDLLTNRYEKQIENSWIWEGIHKEIEGSDYVLNEYEVEEYPDNEVVPINCCFVGTVFSIMPSGKYYMPWCSNQTDKDVLTDGCYWEAMETVLDRHGLFVVNGEGDPCDLFFCKAIDD